ncbi:hypothetical protein ACIBL6_02875 [Streptomyces sp. NPDC050400]|uniref:hypothetical protein n=1 Tax=Streptomyces sp. NPDC050400 TaxID=3365610 RepID=UPI0037A21BE1
MRLLKPVGMDVPPDPPEGADVMAVVGHYLAWYDTEYARIRNVSKARVGRVITLIATLNAVIAVLGVASATWKYAWFGLASTALAGLAGILATRNNLFRDQELWHLRSATLANIQRLKREMRLRAAAGEEPGPLARDLLTQLDEVLAADLRGWAAMGRATAAPAADGPQASA